MDRTPFAGELRLWLILQAARARRVVHHAELAAELSLFVDMSAQRVEELLHNALAEVERYEANADRPMLTSLVVSSHTGAVTDGYVECARLLGHEVDDTPAGRQAFWESQCQLVFDYWSRPQSTSIAE